tara:strand:+ start:282 stop:647 length:366 start_codon:yes stop_codon:yes gene_type:complete
MIEFKGLREALTLKTVPDELIRILKTAAAWSNRSGYNIRITSLNDHVHSKKSLHYEDLAVDFQVLSKNGTPNKRAMSALAKHFKSHLQYGTDVIWNSPDGSHSTHVHVELDLRARPRKNAD